MAHTEETSNALHGVMAEFETGQALVDAARKTMAQGFARVEAYTPVPIEELNDIIHKKRTVLPKLVLCGGLTGMHERGCEGSEDPRHENGTNTAFHRVISLKETSLLQLPTANSQRICLARSDGATGRRCDGPV